MSGSILDLGLGVGVTGSQGQGSEVLRSQGWGHRSGLGGSQGQVLGQRLGSESGSLGYGGHMPGSKVMASDSQESRLGLESMGLGQCHGVTE